MSGAGRHALIIGAGIGGLSAALFLARSGWRISLADRDAPPRETGAGLQLSPNATRLFDRLGLLPALADCSVRPDDLLIRNAGGRVLARSALGDQAEARFGAPFLVIHRGSLHKILLNAAISDPSITLLAGYTLTDLRETENAATGIFDTGSGETRIEADLLVGADGLWSRVRPLTGLPQPSLPQGKTAWRALVPASDAPTFAREARVNLWLGSRAHLVHYPVDGGRAINIVAIIEEDWQGEGWSKPGNPAVLEHRLTDWHADARALIASSPRWNRWALMDRAPENRWSRRCVTLLGDAAHPMLPFLAQGASQAIEDAACLAQSLGKPANARPIAASLAAYDKARLSRTARVQRMARQQGSIYHLSGPMALARDLTLRVLPAGTLLDRYAWIYGHDAETLTSPH